MPKTWCKEEYEIFKSTRISIGKTKDLIIITNEITAVAKESRMKIYWNHIVLRLLVFAETWTIEINLPTVKVLENQGGHFVRE